MLDGARLGSCDNIAPLLEKLGKAADFGPEMITVYYGEDVDEKGAQATADKLEKIYGRKIAVHSEVDSSLLGGAVIRVGDEVIDGSTAGKLRRLRRSLV